MAERDAGKIAFACLHCGNLYTARPKNDTCSNCNTPEKRRKMDEENTAIFKARKLKFICHFCEREAKKNI